MASPNKTKLKHGVRLPPSIAIPIAHTIIAEVFKELGSDCVITSGREGVHKRSSEHYNDRALDYRIWGVRPGLWTTLAKKISHRLGNDFDVVLEADHLHTEYDPK